MHPLFVGDNSFCITHRILAHACGHTIHTQLYLERFLFLFCVKTKRKILARALQKNCAPCRSRVYHWQARPQISKVVRARAFPAFVPLGRTVVVIEQDRPLNPASKMLMAMNKREKKLLLQNEAIQLIVSRDRSVKRNSKTPALDNRLS